MSPPTPQSLHVVRQREDVGAARRVAVTLAEEIGLDETDTGRVALVVTEAGTNIVKHGGGGEIIIGLSASAELAVEMLAIDRGPGIPDIAKSLADGYSTSGTPGNGLGGIRRLSTAFDLFTAPGGTVVLARVASSASRASVPAPRFRLGAVSLPVKGEKLSGDGWHHAVTGDRATCMLVDGLGHGEQAHEAAEAILQVFRERPDTELTELLRLGHGAARSTRGAAVAVAQADLGREGIAYSGVGNISAAIVGPRPPGRSLVSQHGVLGADQPKIKVFDYPFAPPQLLVMHSDGLATRWDILAYPGLFGRDPSVIAGVLYRDFTRGRDDVSVIACSTVEA